MATVEKSPADLEDGSVGCRHSTALGDGGSNNRTSTSSDADGRSWHAPHSSAGGGSSSHEEQNNRSSSLSGTEIVGVVEKRMESFASECSVDLESGVPEDKVHLAKSKRDCRICQLSFDATNQESRAASCVVAEREREITEVGGSFVKRGGGRELLLEVL